MTMIVETSHGKLAGIEAEGVCVFRGIPYARPPLGGLRFRPPEPPEAWAGVREAQAFGPSAPQNQSMLRMVSFGVGKNSEDCLSLNVWTPAIDAQRRPVLVWIHGGAFSIGSGSQPIYDGAHLARRGDVVVVTLNYRLGALGFLRFVDLCGDQLPSSGNDGLLDQIAALQWVQQNIGRFGGDPGQVTIFGQSAGSISVVMLLASPLARGLFRRAILQSGSANFVSSTERAARVAAAFLHELDLGPAQAARLRELPTSVLLQAQQRVATALAPKLGGLPFQPVVDGNVLPRDPFSAVADGAAREIPILIGTTVDEMKMFALTDPAARTLDEDGLLRRCGRTMPGDVADGESCARRAVQTYRTARGARGAPTDPPQLWFAIESDRVFRHPAMRLAELQRPHQEKTYAYLFTWPSPFMDGSFGSCHAVDLPFVFGTLDDPLMQFFAGNTAEAWRLSEWVQDAWLAFARTGTPASAGLEDWPAYDRARRSTMLLGRECGAEEAPLEQERRFWDEIAR